MWKSDGPSCPERLIWWSGTSRASVKGADQFIQKGMRAWPDLLTEALGAKEKLLGGCGGQSQQNVVIHAQYGVDEGEAND